MRSGGQALPTRRRSGGRGARDEDAAVLRGAAAARSAAGALLVRQLLASVGIVKPDTSHLIVRPVQPGDQNAPPRDHVILGEIARRKAWKVEYDEALLAAGPQAWKEHSAIKQSAA